MKIKTYRILRKMTQEELGKAINVDRSTIAKWESGQALPRAGILPLLAKVLRCNIDNFFTSEREEITQFKQKEKGEKKFIQNSEPSNHGDLLQHSGGA